MTTIWQPSGEWAGKTVAVLASGPSMSADVAKALRKHKTIAVNFAVRAAPWADMLVALDGNWPQELRDFAGIRVTGVADDTLDARYIGMVSETLILAEGHVINIRNSGLAAIRVAAGMGASKIILAGFDPEKRGHFYDDEVDTGVYIGVAIGLERIITEMTARGIVVERYEAK
jgi:hypothetical protein